MANMRFTERRVMLEQMNIFQFIDSGIKPYSIYKPIRLIELFGGIGAQAKALERLGADFEHYKLSEWEVHAVASYHKIHMKEDKTDYSAAFTDKELMDKLFELGISVDGKKPMSHTKIKGKGEKWHRRVFNDFMATHNIGSITNIGGVDLEIKDKDKYCYLLTYSFPCFTGDTLILTKDGYKPIKEVKENDYVLTHSNTYQKVIASRMTGLHKTLNIYGMGIDKVCCTENHKFYVRKKHNWTTHRNGKPVRFREFSEPTWIEAKDLKKNDYFGVAINQNNIIPNWEGVDYQWSDGRKKRHSNELGKLINNPLFWWLIGRYVGDGWIRQQGGIVICCAKDELEEITNVADALGIGHSVIEERTVYKVHFPTKELSEFVKPFGMGAENKCIPGYMFDMPCQLLKGFLEGYLSADGCFTNGVFKISSVSRNLIYGTAQLVAKVYKQPYRIYKHSPLPFKDIEGRTVIQKDQYQLVWKTEKKKQDKAFCEDGYIWFPISKIEKDLEKVVYDIEVENDHSFTANGVIAHNCQDLSVAGHQKGMSKDSGTRSGLLWEVERLLKESDELPDVLLMENVNQVHGSKFRADFDKWCDSLVELGYTNFWQDMNAKDYGVAQSRNRTFMVSILQQNVSYEFPKTIQLDKKMSDYLDDKVDKKFYVENEKSQKLIADLVNSDTILDRQTDRQTVILRDKGTTLRKKTDVATTLMARDYKGLANQDSNGVIETNH